MSIDRSTNVGQWYYKKKYIPIDKLLDHYNDLVKLRGKAGEKDLARLDKEIAAIKEVFKETCHE